MTSAVGAFARSATATGRLAVAGRVYSPRDHLGLHLTFADGTTSFVFRETALRAPTADPAVLVVQFRLRLIGTNRLLHRLFRRESALHTPLFAGFDGFRSKLWLSDLRTGVYRGLYEWDGPDLARAYAEALSRLLEILSVRGSVRYHVVAGIRRDDLLRDPTPLAGGRTWWRLAASAGSPPRTA